MQSQLQRQARACLFCFFRSLPYQVSSSSSSLSDRALRPRYRSSMSFLGASVSSYRSWLVWFDLLKATAAFDYRWVPAFFRPNFVCRSFFIWPEAGANAGQQFLRCSWCETSGSCSAVLGLLMGRISGRSCRRRSDLYICLVHDNFFYRVRWDLLCRTPSKCHCSSRALLGATDHRRRGLVQLSFYSTNSRATWANISTRAPQWPPGKPSTRAVGLPRSQKSGNELAKTCLSRTGWYACQNISRWAPCSWPLSDHPKSTPEMSK